MAVRLHKKGAVLVFLRGAYIFRDALKPNYTKSLALYHVAEYDYLQQAHAI